VFLTFENEFKLAIGVMGMDSEKFWELTPAEFKTVFDGFERSKKEKINELLFVAWHTAYFTRVQKPPQLKEVLIDIDKVEPKPAQTPEQMVVACKLITAALGGTFVEV
jgi:hypothetical protein